MPRFAPLLWLVHKLFTCTGTVALLKFLNSTALKVAGLDTEAPLSITATRKERITQLIRETHDEGILSSVQKDIMDRLIDIPDISIDSAMIPISKTEMLDINSDNAALLKRLKDSPFSCYPVYENTKNNIVGFVNIYEVLSMENPPANLQNIIKSIARFSSNISVINAMNKMRKENLPIVLVELASPHRRSTRSKVLGIVKMKDLVEEFTGEIAQW